MTTMTRTPIRLQDMTAVSHDSHVPPLGYIIWFSVPDDDVSVRRVRKLWQLAGLDPKPLPDNPREIDAFKRAVRDEQGRVSRDDHTVIETDVRDIPTNDGKITYQVSRVVRDEAEQVVEYPKALKVWYVRETGAVDFTALGGIPRADVLPMMEGIQDRFEANAKTITGAQVRGLVRRFLTDDNDEVGGLVGLGAENMRGKAGGVYFVLAKYAQQLDGLSEFLSELYPGDRAYLFTVPLADGATEREMIRRQHAVNTIAEIESAVADVRELLREERQRGVRDNVRSHHFRKLERLRRHAAEYSSALQEEQEDLNNHLSVLHGQLRKLLGA